MSLELKEKYEALQKVIDELKNEPGALMPIMQRAQDIFGYLPEEEIGRASCRERV